MLDAEQLATILAEIEAQLNSRPLQRNYSRKDTNGFGSVGMPSICSLWHPSRNGVQTRGQ